MAEPIIFNKQQKATVSLIKNDLRFIYTILKNKEIIKSNFFCMLFPFIGTIIDGAEDWIEAFNNSHKVKLDVPIFLEEERYFYEVLRSSIKMWDKSYCEVRQLLSDKYIESDKYFSNLCKPIAKTLKLYDIYGVDIANNKYCGNTILCSCYTPYYRFGQENGEQIKRLAVIGGKYISIFEATNAYTVDTTMKFSFIDYGELKKSPVGNQFSDRFVLFSLLCQINFMLICIDGFVLEECPTKLRFAYLQYYYMSQMLDELNKKLGTRFTIDDKYVSKPFRNAMAHYKIGVSLKPDEIIEKDLFFGLTQKYFGCDYFYLKKGIYSELQLFANQITDYIGIKENVYV